MGLPSTGLCLDNLNSGALQAPTVKTPKAAANCQHSLPPQASMRSKIKVISQPKSSPGFKIFPPYRQNPAVLYPHEAINHGVNTSFFSVTFAGGHFYSSPASFLPISIPLRNHYLRLSPVLQSDIRTINHLSSKLRLVGRKTLSSNYWLSIKVICPPMQMFRNYP